MINKVVQMKKVGKLFINFGKLFIAKRVFEY